MVRIGIPEYPPRGVREAVANALVHRDYARQGAVHVQWHDDRLEISNPGGFPEGVTTENCLIAQPRPRNPLLSDAFKRAGIVERTGRGIDTVFYEQVRNGRRPPHYTADAAGIKLTLPGGEADVEFVRLVVEEGRRRRPLELDELLLLHELMRRTEISVPDAARLIQKRDIDALDRLQFLADGDLAVPPDSEAGAWRLAEAEPR